MNEFRAIIEENTRIALPKLRKIIDNPSSDPEDLIRKELAQKTLQKDIIRRLGQNQASNTKFIVENGYLDFLNLYDLENLLSNVNLNYPNRILDENTLSDYLKSSFDVYQIIDAIRTQEVKNFTDLELLFLMRNPHINFFNTLIRELKKDYENTIRARSYYDYYDDIYEIFERIHKVAPLTLSHFLVKLLERNDSEIISVLFSQNLLIKIIPEDLNYLLENHDLDLLKEVIKASSGKNLYLSGEEIGSFLISLVKNAPNAYVNHLIWLFKIEDIETITNLVKNYVFWDLDTKSFSYLIENLGNSFLKVLSNTYSAVLKKEDPRSWQYEDEFRANLGKMLQKIDQSILCKCIREAFESDDIELITFMIRIDLIEMLDSKLLKEIVKDKNINFFQKFFKTLELNNWRYFGAEWHGNIFENLNKVAPDVLIKKIIQIIKNGTLHNLATLIFSGILVRYLGEKEFSELIVDQELQFIERVLNTSEIIGAWDSRETDLLFFFDQLALKAKDALINKCIEVCKKESESMINKLVKAGIVEVFPSNELDALINNSKSNFSEALIGNATEEGYSYLIERIENNPQNKSFLKKYILSLNME